MTKWFMVIMAFAMAVAFFTTPRSASACSCAEPYSPSTAFEKTTAVFSGMVISLEGPTSHVVSSADPVTAVFLVDTVWKGPKLDELAITTALSSASCGYEFQIGHWYLVYASGSEDALQVDLCSGTKFLVLADDDLDVLGNGQELVGSQDTQPTAAGDENVVSCNEDGRFNYIALITLISGITIGIGIGVAVAKRHHALKG